MTDKDILQCNNIEKLKELCIEQHKTICSIMSLVNLHNNHDIPADLTIERINYDIRNHWNNTISKKETTEERYSRELNEATEQFKKHLDEGFYSSMREEAHNIAVIMNGE